MLLLCNEQKHISFIRVWLVLTVQSINVMTYKLYLICYCLEFIIQSYKLL